MFVSTGSCYLKVVDDGKILIVLFVEMDLCLSFCAQNLELHGTFRFWPLYDFDQYMCL